MIKKINGVLVIAIALSGMYVQAMDPVLLGAAGFTRKAYLQGRGADVRAPLVVTSSASSSAASEARERDSKRDAELKSSVAAVKMKAPESPRTQSRRALQSVDVGSFKAEDTDIKALEAFLAQAQRQVCRLREQLMIQNAQNVVRSERANLLAQREEAAAQRKYEAERVEADRKYELAKIAAQGEAEAARIKAQAEADAITCRVLKESMPVLTRGLIDVHAQVDALRAHAQAPVVAASAPAPAAETPVPGTVQARTI
jgi:hypothetical protein